MAKINNTDITDSLVKEAGLQTSRETPPTELAEKIIPTLPIQNPIPRLLHLTDDAANDIDKTFTVPEGKVWKFLYGNFLLVTTVTAGNRTMRFNIRDEQDNIIFQIAPINVTIASSTERFLLSSSISNISEDLVAQHLLTVPAEMWLMSGWNIRINDSAAIDTNDDLTINFLIEEYSYGSV